MHPPSPLGFTGDSQDYSKISSSSFRPKENPVVTDDDNATYSLKSLINPIYHRLYTHNQVILPDPLFDFKWMWSSGMNHVAFAWLLFFADSSTSTANFSLKASCRWTHMMCACTPSVIVNQLTLSPTRQTGNRRIGVCSLTPIHTHTTAMQHNEYRDSGNYH